MAFRRASWPEDASAGSADDLRAAGAEVTPDLDETQRRDGGFWPTVKGWARALVQSVWLRACITVALFAAILWNVDLPEIARRIRSVEIGYLLLGVGLLSINMIVVALRWQLMLRRLGFRGLSTGYAIAATYAAIFVGQLLPGTVGADAARGWLSYKKGACPDVAIAALVSDRLLALLGLALVVAAALAWHIDSVDRGVSVQIALLAGFVIFAAVFAVFLAPAAMRFLLRWWSWLQRPHDLIASLRPTLLSSAGAVGLALSCIVHMMAASMVLLSAYGFGIVLAPSTVFLVVPLAILVSTVPITIAGWGLREASLSVGLTWFGVSADDSALLALTLGLGIVVASLPGGIAVLALNLGRSRKDPALRRFE